MDIFWTNSFEEIDMVIYCSCQSTCLNISEMTNAKTKKCKSCIEIRKTVQNVLDLLILTSKTVFYLIQFKNSLKWSLTATDLFLFLYNQFLSIHFIVTCKRVQRIKKYDSSNRPKWTVASFSISARFTAKFELVFVLTLENAFF